MLWVMLPAYNEALSDVFLFFFVDLFDYSIKRQIYNPSKIYCIDMALSRSISFKFSENLGHIYENIVFLELMNKLDQLCRKNTNFQKSLTK